MPNLNESKLLKDKYSIILIGSGLGSLTAAALLANRGLDLLVVEQHYLPGGACTSFKREDRTFDSGAALFFGFGTEGFHPERILMNSLEEPLQIIPREAFFRLDFEGKIITFWKDIDKFVEELKRNFPDAKDEIENLYDCLMDFYENNIRGYEMLTTPSEMTTMDKLKMLFENPKRAINMGQLLKKSAKDILDPYIKSKKLMTFFDMLCSSYIYCKVEETPAILAITTFTENHVGGSYYIANSAQTYSNALEKSIEGNGGTIVYRKKVDKILFEKDIAMGIKLSDGTEIEAEKILSGTTVWNLYNDLIPSNLVSEKQREWVDSLTPTYPAIILHAAVDKSVFPSDTTPVEYYISDSSDIDMGDITMYIPTMDDHTLGPENEHILTIFSPAPNQTWPSPSSSEYQSDDYKSKKEHHCDLILDEIEKRIPDFRKGIKMLFIASPSTIERYTLKNWGCVGGPKQSIGQDLSNRLHAETDWKNLYGCGDSTTMGMGLPAVTVSGFAVANVILREYKEDTYKDIKFDKEYVKSIPFNEVVDIPQYIDNNPENARKIARLCQHCESSPCMIDCPANIDIPNIIRRIEAGNFIGAAQALREINPMAGICSHICPSDSLCEKNCYRKTFTNKAVPIQDLIGWLASYSRTNNWPDYYAKENNQKIAIIGAGPAGLTCSYFLSRLGYDIDLYEKEKRIGGILLEYLNNDRLPEKIFQIETEQMKSERITIFNNWILKEMKQLDELLKNNRAIYLTAPLNFEIDFQKYPTIVMGGRWYSNKSENYEISESIRDGRQAAQKIHNLLSMNK